LDVIIPARVGNVRVG
jgi:hypothetical protein